MRNKDKGIQFAGFDDIEDEEELVTSQTKEKNQTQSTNNFDPQPESEPESYSEPSKSNNSNTVKTPITQVDTDKRSYTFWHLFFVACFIFIIVIINQNEENQLEQDTKNTYSNNSPKKIPIKKEASRTKEIKPAKGSNNILTLNEVYYCLAEEIRINEFGRLKSNYDHSTIDDLFNYYIDDYNSRCSKFRYRQGVLEQAQNQIDLYRENIEYNALYRLDNAGSIFSKINANKNYFKVKAKPKSNKTVRDIQSLLKDLGFSPGPIDGFIGKKTRSAITIYQKLIGDKPDGKATKVLLTKLKLTHKKVTYDCSYYKTNKQISNYKNCIQLFLSKKNIKENTHSTANQDLTNTPKKNSSNIYKQNYITSIKNKITRNWRQPTNSHLLPKCEVFILQSQSGFIQGINFGICPNTENYRDLIETAIYKSSPLPKPQNPDLFDKTIKITFNPH